MRCAPTNCATEIIVLAKLLLDTSVWIEFMRGSEPICSEVKVMLDRDTIVCVGLILAELLQGAKSVKESRFIRNFGDVFEFPAETVDRWCRAGELSATIRSKGVTVPLSDCFIAICASDTRSQLLTFDRHFEEIARFIKLTIRLITI